MKLTNTFRLFVLYLCCHLGAASALLLPVHACGYANRSGKIVIDGLVCGSNFREGLAVASSEHGVSLIRADGTAAASLSGYLGDLTRENYAELYPVRDPKTGAIGYVDTNGKSVIPPRFLSVSAFRDGFATVGGVHGYGLVNRQGKVIVAFPGLLAAGPLSEGLVSVLVVQKKTGGISKSGQGFMDVSGRLVIQSNFDEAQWFSQGLAAVSIKGRWGYIDKTGTIKITPQFDIAGPFEEGLAPVGRRNLTNEQVQWGFIDRMGKFVIPPTFVSAAPFAEGLAAVSVRLNKRRLYGFIGHDGKFVVTPRFSSAQSFSEGLSFVCLPNKTSNLSTTHSLPAPINTANIPGLWDGITVDP